MEGMMSRNREAVHREGGAQSGARHRVAYREHVLGKCVMNE